MRGRAGPGTDGLVDVHLEEDGAAEPEGSPPTVATADPESPARRRPGRRRRAWTGVVLVICLIAVADVVEARRDASRRAGLIQVPGVMAAAQEPVTELWHQPATYVMGVADEVVLLRSAAGALHGVDAVNGAVRWTRGPAGSGLFGWCFALDEAVTSPLRPLARQAVPGAEPTVVCQAAVRDAGAAEPSGAGTTVTVVDGRTGQERRAVHLAGELVTTQPVDRDLLHVSADPHGHLHLMRWDPRTGQRRWTTRTSRAVVRDRSAGIMVDQRPATVTVTGSRTVTVDLDTGEEVRRGHDAADGGGWSAEAVLPDGSVVRTVQRPREASARTEVLGPDGSARFTAEGSAVVPAVQDRADLLVLAGGAGAHLRGVDAMTGEDLWVSGSAGYGLPLLELDGVLLVWERDAVTALDTHDGTLLWEAAVDGGVLPGALTDGDVVLLPVPRGGGTDLVAVDLQDGRERWRSPLPAGTHELRRAGPVVLVQAEDGVHAMG